MGFSPTTGAAITVSASGVTIDLDGHTLAGTAGAGTEAYGVLARNRSNVTVENGKIQGFLAGVYLGAGPPSTPFRSTVRNLKVHGSTYAGIWIEGKGNVIEGCEVLGTGGTTALGPGAGAVGISSVGPAPKLKLNLVMDTVAGSGGSASGIAVDKGTGGLLTGNVVKNNLTAGTTGLLVARSIRAQVLQNGLEAFDYGIVFTHESRGLCQGNVLAAVATPTMGVTCEP
jgi:hypothetical protein